MLAAAAVGIRLGQAELPLAARTLGGFPLAVEGESGPAPDGGLAVRAWSLAGDARIVAAGRLLPDSLQVPPPTVWRGPP